jgi:hypothetical protein
MRLRLSSDLLYFGSQNKNVYEFLISSIHPMCTAHHILWFYRPDELVKSKHYETPQCATFSTPPPVTASVQVQTSAHCSKTLANYVLPLG